MILTPENYYSQEANRFYMSVSQFKDFADNCEAQALAKLNGEYQEDKQDCFTLGSYVHAAVEGPQALADFITKNPDIFSTKGATKGELKSDYKHADKMIQAIMTDPLCKQMLEGEKEIIITAELFGILWKAKLDVRSREDGRLTDLKTVKEIRARIWNDELRRFESFVEHYGYHTQMAVYRELERIHSKSFEPLEPFIVAVSKEKVPDKEIIMFDDETLGNELQRVRDRLPRVIAVKEGLDEPRRCGKCDYCRSTKKASIIHYQSLLEVI